MSPRRALAGTIFSALMAGLQACRRGLLLGLIGCMGLQLAPPAVSARPGLVHQPDVNQPTPTMAYYYIWYDEDSWSRAKSDYPLLGRYSSDDRLVMERHIRWAQDAGIDGFIVSWKSNFKLDRRLETLMALAAENEFWLWIIYQSLDFERRPLPLEQIDADLEYFIERYGRHPAFAMYDQPVVIWSGTWEFSRRDIQAISSSYGDRLLLLASERNVEGYLRLADLVDGNAYYWSSVDPYGQGNHQQKLNAMSQAVHGYNGLWVAPAAPGFDARLIGGTRVIPRQDGMTLRLELDAAMGSEPDAIGLISWNEFSENTHIEPSLAYGNRALEVLSNINAGVPPSIAEFDSSAPGTTDPGAPYPFYVLGTTFLLFTLCLVIVVRRNGRRERPRSGSRHHRSRRDYPAMVMGPALMASAPQARSLPLLLIGLSVFGLLTILYQTGQTVRHWQILAAAAIDPRADSAPELPLAVQPPAAPAAPTSWPPDLVFEEHRFLAAANTYVRESSPETALADTRLLRVDGSPRVVSLLRFDTKTLTDPVSRAVLQVYANSGSTVGLQLYVLNRYDWSTEPLASGLELPLGEPAGRSGPFAAHQWLELDVTATFVPGAQVTFALATRSETNISLASRWQAGYEPRLIVTTRLVDDAGRRDSYSDSQTTDGRLVDRGRVLALTKDRR